jgi:hypothetical protein
MLIFHLEFTVPRYETRSIGLARGRDSGSPWHNDSSEFMVSLSVPAN